MKVEIGKSVVVPGWGVGTVRAIETIDLGVGDQEMYRIELDSDEKKVNWVPLDQMQAQCVRLVMEPKQVKDTLDAIANGTAPEKRATWNRRQRRYNELVAENTPKSLGALMGELAAVRRKKALSFTERRMFDRVRSQLSAEMASALGVPLEKAEKQLDDAIGPRAT